MYGQMQAFTPQVVLIPLKQSPPNKFAEILWGFLNMVPVRPSPRSREWLRTKTLRLSPATNPES